MQEEREEFFLKTLHSRSKQDQSKLSPMWLEPSRVSQLPIHRESPRSSLIAQSNTYNFSGLLLPRHFLKHHTFLVLLTSTPQYYSSKIEQFPKHFEVFSSRTERTSVPGHFLTFLPFTKLPGGGAGAPRGCLSTPCTHPFPMDWYLLQ